MKDAFYFPHDSNASQDPKILQMCSVYGAQGYGWYWMLIEIMRDQENYKLDISGKYACNSLAIRMYTDKDTLVSFLDDCVSEFKLFKQDDTYIWSESLIRRMQTKDIKSQKARESVMHRWNKKSETARPDTNVSKTYYDKNTDVSNFDTKEEKTREEKRKEEKTKEDARACATDGQDVDNLSPGEGNPSSEGEGHGEPDGGSDGELSTDENPDFMTFWNIYPRLGNMSKAMEAWKTLIADGIKPKYIILAAEKYKAYVKKQQTAEQFIKMPHTFLGEGVYLAHLPKNLPDCPRCGGAGWYHREGEEVAVTVCDCRELLGKVRENSA